VQFGKVDGLLALLLLLQAASARAKRNKPNDFANGVFMVAPS
jgi:hypothetical protein